MPDPYVIIVDEEQSPVTSRIIGEVAKSPNVEIRAVTGNFAEAEQMIKLQQANRFTVMNVLSNDYRRGEVGGIGLYLSAANFLKPEDRFGTGNIG